MRHFCLWILLGLLSGGAFAQTPPPGYDAVTPHFDKLRALDDVRFLTDYWRIGGGEHYNIALDRWQAELHRAGFSSDPKADLTHQIIVDDQEIKVWTPRGGSLEIIAPEKKVLHRFEDTPVFLVRNSLPTPPGGITAPLVYVPESRLDDPAVPAMVRNKIILTGAPVKAVLAARLAESGAFGVLSSRTEVFNEAQTYQDLIAEEDVPLPNSTDKPGFFCAKISYRTGQYLANFVAAGNVRVKVSVNVDFSMGRNRTLAAEIRGKTAPDERVVIVSHLDHYRPGANDNATGAATLLEIARSCAAAIASGDMERPDRTLTFIWGDEYQMAPMWWRHSPGIDSTVVAAFVLDMTGADVSKTGGVFRIERAPDPGAIWTRPPDQHTGWGKQRPPAIFGTYLTDWFYNVCRYRVENEGWTVDENPYEGGSDHDSFLARGIPAILAWHFPDRFYHTSMDSIQNVNPETMEHVGISTICAALGLANPTPKNMLHILLSVQARARKRIEVERTNARNNLANAVDAKKVLGFEQRLLTAWAEWYGEAFASIGTLPFGPLPSALAADLEEAIGDILQRAQEPLTQ